MATGVYDRPLQASAQNEEIHEPDFGPEELVVSGKILQWQKRLDTTVKENIAKDVWVEEKLMAQINTSSHQLLFAPKQGLASQC